MMVAVGRDLNTAYAFFERNWNLIRRYIGWEIVWIVYSLVNALTILFIAAATERITGQAVDTRFFVLYLLIGTTMMTTFTDTGATAGAEAPLPPGSLGVWRKHDWDKIERLTNELNAI